MKYLGGIAFLIAILLSNPAFAKKHHHGFTSHHVSHQRIRSHRRVRSYGEAGTVIGGRPAGCPYAFCGCGASIEIFGRIIPKLNLAANWPRMFPKAAPAHNTVAARRHHVMVLKTHVAGDVWIVKDYNSGGHRTRLHPRSIAGYVIVDPRGGIT